LKSLGMIVTDKLNRPRVQNDIIKDKVPASQTKKSATKNTVCKHKNKTIPLYEASCRSKFKINCVSVKGRIGSHTGAEADMPMNWDQKLADHVQQLWHR
jgi:hypothetical protein